VKRATLLLSHLALALAGWGIVSAFVSSPDAAPLAEAVTSPAPQKASGPQAAAVVDRLLAKVAPREDKEFSERPNFAKFDDFRKGIFDKIKEAAKGLELPADLPAAIRQEIGANGVAPKDRFKGPALVLAWLRKDPKAAITFVYAERERGATENHFGEVMDMVLQILGEEIDPELAFTLPVRRERFQGGFESGLASQMIASKSPSEIVRFMQGRSGDLPAAVVDALGTVWPLDHAAELAAMAVEVGSPSALARFGVNQENPAAIIFVVEFMRTHTDPEFVRQIAQADFFGHTLKYAEGLPPQLRAQGLEHTRAYAWMPPEQARQVALMDSLVTELDSLVSGEDSTDLAYHFYRGDMEAGEILASLPAASLEGIDPASLRSTLFLFLGSTDPARAGVLLDGLAPSQRTAAITGVIEEKTGKVAPPVLAKLIEMAPPPADSFERKQRFSAWEEIVPRHYDVYGENYLEWAKSLPRGVDRDMVLTVLAVKLSKEDWQSAATLRGMVEDPVLKLHR
jgi:hypothetical protein